MLEGVSIRSPHLKGVELSWFAPLCNDDYEFLGVPDPQLRSSFANTKNIVLAAEAAGFRNILCPSSYQVGQDTLSFVAAMAQHTHSINLLAAIRCGEVHPPMLARTLATIDHMLKGRLTVNIISSDLPGETLDSPARYRRSHEVVEILKQCWTQDHVSYDGEFYKIKELMTDPVKPYQQNGGPLLYFGGYAPEAKELCAAHCDVYLMWPETEDKLATHMRDLTTRAAIYGRMVDFGLRVHVIVRETEREAKQYAEKLVSRLDDEKGKLIRDRSQDAKSFGVSLQAQLRDNADSEGYVEDNLWTGVGRARSGCGAALVGDPDQILAKLQRYMDMGIRAFILSGYPHMQECNLFGRYVLPRINTVSMPIAQHRLPGDLPATPLTTAERK